MQIEYGTEQLPLPLDEDEIVDIVKPREVKTINNPVEAIRESIANPIESPSFEQIIKGKKRALFLTVDATRPSPALMMLPLIERCKKQNVETDLMITIGRHRQMTPEEIRNHVTPDVADLCGIYQHDPFDDSIHNELGETKRGTSIKVNQRIFDYDVVIGTGIIEPSYLCGFSGGRKQIMPGISHHKSIDANHYWLLDDATRVGTLDGNPVSEDATEIARMVPYHWITYEVVDAFDKPVHYVSGDPFAAHRYACNLSREIFLVNRQGADIVISSPGAHPYDVDLVQGKKGIVPAYESVNEGGVVIVLASCPEGFGAEKTFSDWIQNYSPDEIVTRVRDKNQFSLGAHGANLFAKTVVDKKATVILVTNASLHEQMKGSFIRTTTSLEEAIQWAREIKPSSNVLVIRHGRRLIVE